jgi:hypothetical protein
MIEANFWREKDSYKQLATTQKVQRMLRRYTNGVTPDGLRRSDDAPAPNALPDFH